MTDLSPTWTAYRAVVDNLVSLRGELGEIQVAEVQAKHRAMLQSQDTSITGRKQEGDLAAGALTEDRLKTQAEIAAREDVRDMLRLAIEHGVEIVGGDGG